VASAACKQTGAPLIQAVTSTCHDGLAGEMKRLPGQADVLVGRHAGTTFQFDFCMESPLEKWILPSTEGGVVPLVVMQARNAELDERSLLGEGKVWL